LLISNCYCRIAVITDDVLGDGDDTDDDGDVLRTDYKTIIVVSSVLGAVAFIAIVVLFQFIR